jgi:hypothetical protein
MSDVRRNYNLNAHKGLTIISLVGVITDEKCTFDCLPHDCIDDFLFSLQMRECLNGSKKVVCVMHGTNQLTYVVVAGETLPYDLMVKDSYKISKK